MPGNPQKRNAEKQRNVEKAHSYRTHPEIQTASAKGRLYALRAREDKSAAPERWGNRTAGAAPSLLSTASGTSSALGTYLPLLCAGNKGNGDQNSEEGFMPGVRQSVAFGGSTVSPDGGNPIAATY